MRTFEVMQQQSQVSLFGHSAPALVVMLAVDLMLTLLHSVQELKGPLWRYFGAITGLRIPDALGFALFFLSLTAILWAVGFAGIAGYLPIYGLVGAKMAMVAVGGLIGGRLSDGLYSHVRLDRQGYRPNPGLPSTPYYFAEAAILTVLFLPGLRSHSVAAAIGFLVGWLFFYSILPLLRSLRVIPSLRREPWKPGETIPSSARW